MHENNDLWARQLAGFLAILYLKVHLAHAEQSQGQATAHAGETAKKDGGSDVCSEKVWGRVWIREHLARILREKHPEQHHH